MTLEKTKFVLTHTHYTRNILRVNTDHSPAADKS